MTRAEKKLGPLCLSFAVVACIALAALSYIKSLGVLRGGVILSLLDALGLVRDKPSPIAVMTVNSYLSFDDANAVLWLAWLAYSLVLIAVAHAFHAEWQGERSVYSAASFVVATMGICLLSVPILLTIYLAGLLALQAIRNKNLR